MSSQLSFSFELIALMEWLLKHGEKHLEDLVKEAVKKGFAQELETMEDSDYTDVSTHINQTISDFVVKFEDIIFKEVDGLAPKANVHDALAPAIKNLDHNNLDFSTMLISMQKTKSTVAKAIQKSGKENQKTPDFEIRKIWYNQLLKNWDPKSNEPVN
jgi:hypothetical protein